MPNDRAIFWMCICLLLIVGILLGQLPAISIAAATAGVIAYLTRTSSGEGERPWGDEAAQRN